jgi:hypothetical protein
MSSENEKWYTPNESECIEAAKAALTEAMNAFKGLNDDSDVIDTMKMALIAFRNVKVTDVGFKKKFELTNNGRKCHSFFYDYRHIVVSAFYAASNGISATDVHPFSKAGAQWSGIIAACNALAAASYLFESFDSDQFGETHVDDVLKLFYDKSD